jgi:hypothetical protein
MKTLVLMATLKRVYKGGKKAAERKSKSALVNALYKVYGKKKKISACKTGKVTKISKVSGTHAEYKKKAIERNIKKGIKIITDLKSKGRFETKDIKGVSEMLAMEQAQITAKRMSSGYKRDYPLFYKRIYSEFKTKIEKGIRKGGINGIGAKRVSKVIVNKNNKFGIDVERPKDITLINDKIRAKIEKFKTLEPIQKAVRESNYLHTLSFTDNWKKDLKGRLQAVRKKTKTEYCKTVRVANHRIKYLKIHHVIFSKTCKR